MNSFGFSLAENIFLREESGNYCLYSRFPLRILRLNKTLYALIKFTQRGGSLAEFAAQNPGLNPGNLLRILLSLTSRGYLRLDTIPPLETHPDVAVVIPVKDQFEDVVACLEALEELDYPQEKLEIVVIDDHSKMEISRLETSFNARVIRQEITRGPAFSRNFGASATRAGILAFLDADCVPDEDWLSELLPFFQATSVGAIGGYIEGYYQETMLDRYEEVASSLNMGNRLILEGKSESSFYVPTANLLVTREAFHKCGGFEEGMRIGEDVDFCWRLRDSGYSLLYVPRGTVAHKHRGELDRMLKRRGEYGTSEAVLYRNHRDKKKIFNVSVYPLLIFLALAVALVMLNPYPLCVIPPVFLFELWRKSVTLKKHKMPLPAGQVAYSILRTCLSFFYFTSFHLVRYYLILLLIPGFFLHSFWLFDAWILLVASLVDYFTKKPDLLYPVYLFFYLGEHLAYQVGVFWGCWKERYFGSYLVSFRRA
jgi:mycofactocin system glycosyltransferase